MTIRDLIKQLNAMDDDVKDARICVKACKSWNQTTITIEAEITEVPDTYDVDLNRFYLQAR